MIVSNIYGEATYSVIVSDMYDEASYSVAICDIYGEATYFVTVSDIMVMLPKYEHLPTTSAYDHLTKTHTITR